MSQRYGKSRPVLLPENQYVSVNSIDTPRTLLNKVIKEKIQRHSSTYVLNDQKTNNSTDISKASLRSNTSKKQTSKHFISESEENMTPDFLLVSSDKRLAKKKKTEVEPRTKRNFKFSKVPKRTSSGTKELKSSSSHRINASSNGTPKVRNIEDLFSVIDCSPARTIDADINSNKNVSKSSTSKKVKKQTVSDNRHKKRKKNISDDNCVQNDMSHVEVLPEVSSRTVPSPRLKRKNPSPIKSKNIEDLFGLSNCSIQVLDDTEDKITSPENEDFRIPNDVTHSFLQHFSDMPIPNNTMSVVNLCCDDFWQQTLGTLSAYAKHAGRDSISVADIELLLYRQGYVQDRNSINSLITKFLPFEMAMDVLPIATAKNNI